MALANEALRDVIQPKERKVSIESILRLAEPGQLYLNATELVAMSAAETLATAMGALTMPKTYLLGSPGGSGARTRELLALADVAWSAVPNAGHWPFIDQTDLCAAEIGGFLQRLEV